MNFVLRNKLKLIPLQNSELAKSGKLSNSTICSTLKRAKCKNDKFAVALSIKHPEAIIPEYRTKFLVGNVENDLIIGRLSLATHWVIQTNFSI